MAKQVSVFIENRQGRLGEVLRVLKENKVNILSLSLADTTEYGLLRLIVNNPDLGKEKLAEAGFSTTSPAAIFSAINFGNTLIFGIHNLFILLLYLLNRKAFS